MRSMLQIQKIITVVLWATKSISGCYGSEYFAQVVESRTTSNPIQTAGEETTGAKFNYS